MSAVNQLGKYQPYPAYQKSEAEWIGQLPSEWNLKRGKYVFHEINERSESGDEQLLSVSEYYGVKPRQDVAEEGEFLSRAESLVGYKKCQVDDLAMNIMLAWKTGLGVSEYEGIISPAYAVFRFYLSVAVPAYMHYLLRTEMYSGHFKTLSTGVIDSRLRLYPETFSTIEIVLPSVEEQRSIAAFLDYETARIDRLIAQQQRLIELLKEKRQAVISHAVTKGLNPNAPMKDSGVEWLGQVPEHWVVGPIKYTLQSKKGACKAGPFGSHLTNDDMTGSDVKVITQRNVIDDDMEVGDSYISSDKYKELRAFTIQKGDILVTTRGTIGRTALFQQEYTAILHPCLIRLQADGAILLPEWLSLLIQESGYVVEQILIKSNATTIEVIYSESLLNVDIAYPPSESEQIDVLDFINCQKMKFQHLISAAGRAISLMQERRTALISAAVTGKIDLRGWTPPADEVAA
ncbi:TPA: restriction endonuclease subunit S [Aeromonas hydrophila]